jgi:hypothetical protein
MMAQTKKQSPFDYRIDGKKIGDLTPREVAELRRKYENLLECRGIQGMTRRKLKDLLILRKIEAHVTGVSKH